MSTEFDREIQAEQKAKDLGMAAWELGLPRDPRLVPAVIHVIDSADTEILRARLIRAYRFGWDLAADPSQRNPN